MAALLSSCFTGIESTPRISQGDVKRRDAAQLTPEQQFLADIMPLPPSQWQTGKRFFVTDDKISIIFMPSDTGCDSLSGSDLVFESFTDVPSVTGNGATMLTFTSPGHEGELHYRVNSPTSDLQHRDRLEVPFAIERSIVDQVDSLMRSRTFYITTPKWFVASDGKDYFGKRHIPVTIGSDRAATRNFNAVFNFNDPRKRYPQITDETWQMIVNSKVAAGMTRDECRLALGAPNSFRTIPVYNAVVEQWNYDDGMYLIFEDGILTRYRI